MHPLQNYISPVENFPKEGIRFYDIAPLLETKLTEMVDAFSAQFTEEEWQKIDVIAGAESRGFLFASALAYKHGKGVVLIRKKGKLPNVAVSESYGLEYGDDVLEMQAGSGNVLLVDDVLATGGTLTAAANLCANSGRDVVGIGVLINLPALNDFSWRGLKAKALMSL